MGRRALVVVVVVAALASLGGRGPGAQESSAPMGPLVVYGRLQVDPAATVLVHTWFPGEILEMGTVRGADGDERPLRVGDQVKAGQLLAVVHSDDRALKMIDLFEAFSLFNMERDRFLRVEGLYRKEAISEQAYREALHEVQAAGATMRRRMRLLQLRHVSAEEIDGLREDARQLQDNIAEVLRRQAANPPFRHYERWSRVEVRATAAGTILAERSAVGDLVQPEDDMLTLADTTRLIAAAQLPEAALGALPREARWTLRLRSSPDAPITAPIEVVGPAVDPETQQIALSGRVPNPDGRLRPGMTFQATIEPRPAADR